MLPQAITINAVFWIDKLNRFLKTQILMLANFSDIRDS